MNKIIQGCLVQHQAVRQQALLQIPSKRQDHRAHLTGSKMQDKAATSCKTLQHMRNVVES